MECIKVQVDQTLEDARDATHEYLMKLFTIFAENLAAVAITKPEL